ncbi:MAG: hypothetical protein KGR26_11890, partial [Cyanobacteria bacterium REEB65]|nr:hypothetical protein [Cyanobacteria bacterium REEB65]
MGFLIGRSQPKVRTRAKVATWNDRQPRPIWLLIAGPGSGKTYTALLMAEQSGLPLLFFEGCADPGIDELATFLPAKPPAAGSQLAQRFKDYLAVEHPRGAAIVFDSVERVLCDPAAVAFLESWLSQAGNPNVTILTSRVGLPFGLARRIAIGEVAVVRRADLWWSEDEVVSPDKSLDPELLDAIQGWPLGIQGIMSFGDSPGAKPSQALRFLQDLASQELLASLPADLAAMVDRLGAVPHFDPTALERIWPHFDWQGACTRLYEWGLLLEGSRERLYWHPLVLPAVARAWVADRPASDVEASLEALGAALVAEDPEAALALGVA